MGYGYIEGLSTGFADESNVGVKEWKEQGGNQGFGVHDWKDAVIYW